MYVYIEVVEGKIQLKWAKKMPKILFFDYSSTLTIIITVLFIIELLLCFLYVFNSYC